MELGWASALFFFFLLDWIYTFMDEGHSSGLYILVIIFKLDSIKKIPEFSTL